MTDMIIFSLYPEYARKVSSGKKRYEFRKKINKAVKPGCLAAIWETIPTGEINCICEIGHIYEGPTNELWERFGDLSGVTKEYFDEYFGKRARGYAIEIKDVKALERSIRLSDIREKIPSFNAPQSFYRLSTKKYGPVRDMIKQATPPIKL